MDEKKENNQENTATEANAPVQKTGFFGKVKNKFKKADKTAAEGSGNNGEEPKKPFKQKLKDNKGKIIGAVLITATAVGAGLKMLANAKAGKVDPEYECEPGDDYPVADESEPCETSEEEVNEE